MNPDDVVDAVKWYEKERPIHESAADRIYELIFDILESEKVNFQNIESRAKELNSFKAKLERISISNFKQMQDLIGVRIICYVESDVENIGKIIEKNFEVDQEKITDKTEQLGVDKVGYRSKHYVVKLKKDRGDLAEYKNIRDLHFEIQVRTILQHAWAEFSHGRNYKFSGILPVELARKMNLLSGTLEIVDGEFQQISDALEKYSDDVLNKTKKGELDIRIDSTSLPKFMDKLFQTDKRVIPKIGRNTDVTTELIILLQKLGIHTLKELDKIIPKDIVERNEKYGITSNSYERILRQSMEIFAFDEYVHNIGMGVSFSKDYAKVLQSYGVDENKLKKHLID